MNILQDKNSYSEVFELLKYIDRKDLKKIPINILKTIKENRNEDYIPNIDFNNIASSINHKALSLYMWLYLTYITDNTEEKEEINKILYQNEIKEEDKLKQNNIFKEKTNDKNYNENIPIVVSKPNILIRIINKIKSFFSKRK